MTHATSLSCPRARRNAPQVVGNDTASPFRASAPTSQRSAMPDESTPQKDASPSSSTRRRPDEIRRISDPGVRLTVELKLLRRHVGVSRHRAQNHRHRVGLRRHPDPLAVAS